ncbi:MAG: bifunctional DedA family/phosphatase PAP2 family protein [Patescibacteria group bacterium]
MSHLFEPIIHHIEIILEHGGYVVLLLVSILEGVPIIGPLVPGHTIVVLSGFLSRIGILDLYAVTFIVVFGAMLGDVIGYMLGKKYGFAFLSRYGKYFFIKESHIEKAKQIVQKHTGKAIIFGRFNPITRPLAPFAVGASGVHIKKFWIFDAIGVCLWATLSIAAGYIFGASYHIIAASLGKYIVIAIILTILILWGYYFINKRFHLFARYELIALIANLLGLYIFSKTLQDALSNDGFMIGLDLWMNTFFSSYTTACCTGVMHILTNVFSPEAFAIIGLLGTIFFFVRKQWRYGAITLLSFGGGVVINGLIKSLFMRARPLESFIVETGYSFPSAHSTVIAIAAVLAIYFFARKIRSLVWRELYIVGVSALALLIAFSRVYLGVHWFSDVVAGIALGVFWSTLTILLVRYLGMIYTNLLRK